MTQKTIAQEQEDLDPGDELFLIEQYTNEDGTVQCRVTDWERPDRNQTKIIVHGMTPWGDTFEHQMDWPRRNDPEKYEFVELCEAAGYTLGQAKSLRNDDDVWIKAKDTRRGFRFDPPEPPEPEPTRRERVAERTEWFREGCKRLGAIIGLYFMLMTWTVSFPVMYAFYEEKVKEELNEPGEAYIFLHLVMMILWLATGFAGWAIYEGMMLL